MKIRNAPLAAAALALAAGPVLAQATFERASAPVDAESKMGGSSLIIGVLAASAIIAGIIVAADSDDEEGVSG
ncbi:MAG: hypothetical protein AAGH57_08755 [Pseudomonadota bacterium]